MKNIKTLFIYIMTINSFILHSSHHQSKNFLSRLSAPNPSSIEKMLQLKPKERNQTRLNNLLFVCTLHKDTKSSTLLIKAGADPRAKCYNNINAFDIAKHTKNNILLSRFSKQAKKLRAKEIYFENAWDV